MEHADPEGERRGRVVSQCREEVVGRMQKHDLRELQQTCTGGCGAREEEVRGEEVRGGGEG